jgi:hypothetical protein
MGADSWVVRVNGWTVGTDTPEVDDRVVYAESAEGKVVYS